MTKRPKPVEKAETEPKTEVETDLQAENTVIIYDCENKVLGRYESNYPLTDKEVRRIGAAIRRAYEAPQLREQLDTIDHQLTSLQRRKAEISKKLGEADGRRDTPFKPRRASE